MDEPADAQPDAWLEAGASWVQRVRGSILWAACGDALGRPFEGRRLVNPRDVDELMERPPAVLTWTDDTALMLALAEHLVRHDGAVDQDRLATRLADEWARDPGRGYGQGAARLFQQVSRGRSWRRVAPQLFDGGSAGNGAAMRVAPVGLLPEVDLGTVAALADAQAQVTHAHPLGQAGAVVQAVAVALAARTTPGEPLDVDWFVEQLLAHLPGNDPLEFALPQVADVVRQARTPVEVAANLGNGVTAIESVPTALACFLIEVDDPRQALRWAIIAGGDTDTIACMTGALAGARHGDSTLPDSWVAGLEASERIADVATQLARLPGVASTSVVEPSEMVYELPVSPGRRIARIAEWIWRGR